MKTGRGFFGRYTGFSHSNATSITQGAGTQFLSDISEDIWDLSESPKKPYLTCDAHIDDVPSMKRKPLPFGAIFGGFCLERL